MPYILLIPFFLLLFVFIIISKSDLYTHEHDAELKTELENFNNNSRALENLEIGENYRLNNSHFYSNN